MVKKMWSMETKEAVEKNDKGELGVKRENGRKSCREREIEKK